MNSMAVPVDVLQDGNDNPVEASQAQLVDAGISVWYADPHVGLSLDDIGDFAMRHLINLENVMLRSDPASQVHGPVAISCIIENREDLVGYLPLSEQGKITNIEIRDNEQDFEFYTSLMRAASPTLWMDRYGNVFLSFKSVAIGVKGDENQSLQHIFHLAYGSQASFFRDGQHEGIYEVPRATAVRALLMAHYVQDVGGNNMDAGTIVLRNSSEWQSIFLGNEYDLFSAHIPVRYYGSLVSDTEERRPVRNGRVRTIQELSANRSASTSAHLEAFTLAQATNSFDVTGLLQSLILHL